MHPKEAAELKAEIARLKAVLTRKNLALKHLSNITYGPVSKFAAREAAARQPDASKDEAV